MSAWDKVRSYAESRESDVLACVLSYGDARELMASRHLVEEALGERDRLKGELAEARDCGGACGTVGHQCQECLRKMFHRELARREAAEAELAEAGRLIEYLLQNGRMKPVAATTSEQAQPWVCPAGTKHTPGSVRCLCGPSGFVRETAEQAQPTYEDGEDKPRPQLNTEHLISSTPLKATEQAQGEAAHMESAYQSWRGCRVKCTSCLFVREGLTFEQAVKVDDEHRATHRPPIAPGGGLLDDVNAQVAALAKRVEALEVDFGRLAQDSATQGCMVDLQNKVAKLEERCDECGWPARAIMHGDNTGPLSQHAFVQPAPPPPEAAGPGHALPSHTFLGHSAEATQCGISFDAGKTECGHLRAHPIHAVPPIPEGGAR